MSLATVAAVVGIGAGANSIYQSTRNRGGGGGGGGGGASAVYQPQGQGTIDQDWLKIFQQYLDQGGDLQKLMQIFVPILQQQAGVSAGAQKDLMGAGGQLWQTAQDPQNALRDKLQQQVTDASRAGTSARGIGMGGEAAGIENQDVQNFLMNWQNQQLQRQATGLQGMTGAYNEAGRQGQGVGQNLSGAATMQTLPMQQLLAALGAGGNYLGIGQSASNIGFGQQQTGLNNLTTGLGQLSNLYRPQQIDYSGYATGPGAPQTGGPGGGY